MSVPLFTWKLDELNPLHRRWVKHVKNANLPPISKAASEVTPRFLKSVWSTRLELPLNQEEDNQ